MQPGGKRTKKRGACSGAASAGSTRFHVPFLLSFVIIGVTLNVEPGSVLMKSIITNWRISFASGVWMLGGFVLFLFVVPGREPTSIPIWLFMLLALSLWSGLNLVLAMVERGAGNLTSRICVVAVLLCSAWQLQAALRPFHHVVSEEDRRRHFADACIYQGAPFCCIYVGLDTNEEASFDATFWHFASQHSIHRPQKHHGQYSGPPLATCKSDHVSVFLHPLPASYIVEQHEFYAKLLVDSPEMPVRWQDGIDEHAYWPTNASRITLNGHEVLAPLTGAVRMAPNDTNYSLQDFKNLTTGLTVALQAAFPNRAVSVFSYDGDPR